MQSFGSLGTLTATSVGNRHASREREAVAADARRQRAASILGRVRTFLTDIEPERIGFNANLETTPTELDGLAVRLSALRDELSVFAAGDPDDRVMGMASKLESTLFNAFIRVRWHARDLLTHQGGIGLLQRRDA